MGQPPNQVARHRFREDSLGKAEKSHLGPDAAVHLPQQQRPGIRGNVAAVEIGDHRMPPDRFKLEQRRRTLCLH